MLITDSTSFVIEVLFLTSFILATLSYLALKLTLDKRVRKALPDDKVYDGFYDSFFGFLRTSLFANASILPGKRFQKTMDIFYDGFQIKSFANAFEKTMALLYLISISLLTIVCLGVFFTDFLGLVTWADA
ncbi:MAG: hypothetical protein ACRBBR_05695 [Cellvibrionaceae bacterium]